MFYFPSLILNGNKDPGSSNEAFVSSAVWISSDMLLLFAPHC